MPQLRIAPPLTRDQIEEIAWQARAAVGLGPYDRVPVANVLEHVLPELIPDYVFEVEETRKLAGAEAITNGFKPVITFSALAYDRLRRNEPRARMTGAHELGHLLLHTGRTGYAFLSRRDARLDPEKQADIFAEAFLMPECAFRRIRTIQEAMEGFGVSRDAACYRARQLTMRFLLHGPKLAVRKKGKKKGHDMRRAP